MKGGLVLRKFENEGYSRVEVAGRAVWLPKPETREVFVRTEYAVPGMYHSIAGWKAVHVKDRPTLVYDIVTDDYKIVSHEEAIQKTREVIKALEYDILKEELVVEGTLDSRIFYKALLWDTEIQEGDEIGLGVMVTNSYDRSLGLVAYLYGLRLVCLNEMVFGREILKIKTLHKGGDVLGRFAKNLQELLLHMEDVQIFLKRLIGANVPSELIDNFLKSMRLANKYQKLIKARLPVGDEIPAWDLYNAVTYVLTHKAEMSYERRAELLRKLNVHIVPLLTLAENR